MKRALVGWVAIVAFSALAAGCSVRCEVPLECDVRDRGCQQQVLDALQCVRGGERVGAPIRVVAAEDYADDRVDEIDPEDVALREHWYEGLARFELLPDGLSAQQATRADADRVGAFYDSDTREVTILDRGTSMSDLSAINVLAHELVHAQQDAEHDLDALIDRHGDTYDGFLAVDAVIEGEATLYAGQLAAYALGFELDDVSWDEMLREGAEGSRKDAAMSDDPFHQLRWSFTYPFGARYVNAAFEAGGNSEVAALYDEPPVSTREVLQGYGESPPGGKPWLEPELAEQAVPELEDFPSHIGSEQYGAYALEVALRHWSHETVFDWTEVEEVAARLRADVFSVLVGDGLVASWRLRFTDAGTARRARDLIRDGLRAAGEELAIAVVDRDVLVVDLRDAGDDIELASLVWGPIAFDGGQGDEKDGTAPRRAGTRRACDPSAARLW